MSPHVRKVRTASGATAVQVVTKRGGRRVKIVHVGSVHSQDELAVLEARARAMLSQQGELDLGLGAADQLDTGQAEAIVAGQSSVLLWQVLQHAWRVLGLDAATDGDRGFEQMCLARLVEPTSKAQVPALVADLGIVPVSRRSLFRSLSKAAQDDYRARVQRALYSHAAAAGDLSLALYDVTTLYFETESEDKVCGPNQGLRRVGYSKERRVDPQVIVGLLTDRAGFPLRAGMWEGNKAETTTILPTVKGFLADTGRDPSSLVVGC